jgi:hypothetical protein
MQSRMDASWCPARRSSTGPWSSPLGPVLPKLASSDTYRPAAAAQPALSVQSCPDPPQGRGPCRSAEPLARGRESAPEVSRNGRAGRPGPSDQHQVPARSVGERAHYHAGTGGDGRRRSEGDPHPGRDQALCRAPARPRGDPRGEPGSRACRGDLEASARGRGDDPRFVAQVGQLQPGASLENPLNSAAYEALCLGSDRDAQELLDRAMPIARELDEPLTWAIFRANCGLAALFSGDTDTAQNAFCDELRVCRLRPPAPGLRRRIGIGRDRRASGRRSSRRAASPAPRPHTATVRPTTPNMPGSERRFWSRRAAAAASTHGTPLPATAPRSASRRRPPTPSTSRTHHEKRSRATASTGDRSRRVRPYTASSFSHAQHQLPPRAVSPRGHSCARRERATTYGRYCSSAKEQSLPSRSAR